jgi:hypothetical protein
LIAAHSWKELAGCCAIREFWTCLRDETELLGTIWGAIYRVLALPEVALHRIAVGDALVFDLHLTVSPLSRQDKVDVASAVG